MKNAAIFAIIAGAAAITAAVVLKKRNDRKFDCCNYDAGDLEKDDCAGCAVCGDELDIEPLVDADDADTGEVPADSAPDTVVDTEAVAEAADETK